MALTKLTTVLNKISSLATIIRGQATTTKAAFDNDVNVVKDFINNTLTVEIDTLDAANVKKTGAQTVSGVKTFSDSPVVPSPTADMQASTKKYVDDMGTSKSNDLNTHKTSSDHDGRYYTETELSSVTDNSSGADKIGVTPIPTLTGETAQLVLESIKGRLDNIGTTNTNVELSNSHYASSGQIYSSIGARGDAVDAKLVEIDSELAQIATDYVKKDESTNGSFPLDVSGWTYLYTNLPTASESNKGGYLYCSDGDGTHGAGNYRSSGTAWYFGGTGDEGYSKLHEYIFANTKYRVSNNLFNSQDTDYKQGYTIAANGTISANASYDLSGYTPVEAGKTVYFYNNNVVAVPMVAIVAFNSNKERIAAAAAWSTSYTIPDGCAYIRYSVSYTAMRYRFLVTYTSGDAYVPYFAPYYSIKNTYPNLTVSFLGDSLTIGFVNGTTQLESPFPTIVKNLMGLGKINNYGISGSRVANNGSSAMSVRYQYIDTESDVILIMGGTNDFPNSTLGAIGDTSDTTFYGGWNVMSQGLIANHPNAIIVVVTFPHNLASASNSNYNNQLLPFHRAELEIADKYAFPVIDTWRCGLCGYNANQHTSDGTHFTQDFVTNIFAPFIAEKLDKILQDRLQ